MSLSTRQEGKNEADANGDAERLQRVLLDLIGEVVVQRGNLAADSIRHVARGRNRIVCDPCGLCLQLVRRTHAKRFHTLGKICQIFAKLGELGGHIGCVSAFEGLLDLVVNAGAHACHGSGPS
ncbi:hypothetical protein AGR9A_Lc40207 [Agrobacterium salinitolerans str. Hayward 0363]|nr:hypothetical protein AGR9A_Lc40207 [Agrobacterium salinitolerans str. Hayward 0363]